MQFMDHDGSIILDYRGAMLTMERETFLELEPSYSLPKGQITRYLKKEGNSETYWLSDGANQSGATDFTAQDIAGFCRKLATYRKAIAKSEAGEAGTQG
jgi:hypothetical protein